MPAHDPGRPDHRRRRLRRGARVEPGGHAHEHLCLEQGDWVEPGDSPGHRDRLGAAPASATSTSDPNVRRRPEDYPVNDADSPISAADVQRRRRQHHPLSAHFPRFHPSDFRVRTLDGVADDWPLDYDELEPFYDAERAHDGRGRARRRPGVPAEGRSPLPPVPLGKLGETLARGFNRLGWHWWPSDSAIITAATYEGRPACINCGPCDIGCPQRREGRAPTSPTGRVALRRGVRAADPLPRARDHRRTTTGWPTA